MKRRMGIFLGVGKATEEDIYNLEKRIVKITPKIRKEYKEIIEIYNFGKDKYPNIRTELIWEE